MTPRRILVLDASSARVSVALVFDDRVIAERGADGQVGIAGALPGMVQACLGEALVQASDLDALAVMIGPGSFTGLRASIALARGIGTASALPVHGVTLTEAFSDVQTHYRQTHHRPLWIAVTTRRGRVFLEREGVAASYADDALPAPFGPIAIAGDQAAAVAAQLVAAGHDVLLTGARHAAPLAMANSVRARHAAGLPPRPAIPAYIDPPEAKLPAQGLRVPPLPR